MIPKHTIDQIFEAAYIEEVVGEFVHLKKQGATFRERLPLAF
jgi:DNA primase